MFRQRPPQASRQQANPGSGGGLATEVSAAQTPESRGLCAPDTCALHVTEVPYWLCSVIVGTELIQELYKGAIYTPSIGPDDNGCHSDSNANHYLPFMQHLQTGPGSVLGTFQALLANPHNKLTRMANHFRHGMSCARQWS